MPHDRNGVTYHSGCEMCGCTEETPYYEGVGFFCQKCAAEESEHRDIRLVKGLWAPHAGNTK
jgi:hypothetical protein